MLAPPLPDLIGIIQGYSVAPYAEQGRLINNRSTRDFEQLMEANAPRSW